MKTITYKIFTNNLRAAFSACLLFACLVLSFSSNVTKAQTTYNYTGGVQTYTVPAGVTTLTVDVKGAAGGLSTNPSVGPGGNGGRVTGSITVTPGAVLNVYVGGAGGNGTTSVAGAGGYNGGALGGISVGSYSGGGGGGASDIRVSPYALANRLVVAGGGGGGAFNYSTAGYDRGGMGGGLIGEGGYAGNILLGSGNPGAGGTQVAGGAAGNYPGYCAATAGSLGFGGAAGTCGNTGGGGGGGYYGGGGGVWAGGGGGSNFLSGGVHTQGFQASNGQVIITAVAAPCTTPTGVTATSSTICVGQSSNLTAVSTGNNILWYTVSTGGTSIGSSLSGANFSVSPVTTTTYYAEAFTAGGSGTQTFNYTGGLQTFTVPAGVSSITVDVKGASGYGALGYGGRVQATHPVTAGEILEIYVGGTGTETTGGYNGGGAAGANTGYGSGGGASDIRRAGSALANRIIVAGGGGGTGSNCGTNSAEGGDGGGLTGGSGCAYSCSACQYTGAGGSQVAGGIAGPTAHGSCTGNQNGSLGLGGSNTTGGYGTGGGGGYYGGGSGCFEGAGGGSSYTGPSAGSVTHTAGFQIGNGQIIISWNGIGCTASLRTAVTVTVNSGSTAPSSVSGTATICSGSSTTLTSVGGVVGTGAVLNWYTGSCGGTLVGTGSTITVSPVVNTTYYVRAQGLCNTTSCASLAVVVDQSTTSNAGPDQTVCVTTATLAGNVPVTGGGIWTLVSGAGTITTPTSPTTTVTALGAGPNTFRWTLPNGTCADSQDDVIITGDNVTPVINCPANISTNNSVGQCGATVTFTAPIGTDNCPNPATTQIGGLASGSSFPIGSSTNTFRVTDVFGNTSTCAFTVTVTDTEAPTWTSCPANMTVSTASNSCDAVVTWTAPTASDNCSVTSSSGSMTPGSTFPLGLATVTYSAVDAAGNNGTCVFTVTVADNIAPIAICQPDTIVLDSLGNGTVNANDFDNGSSDNCTVDTVMVSQTSFNCSNAGLNTLTLTVTDGNGNTSTCTAILSVIAQSVLGSIMADTTTCGFNVSCNSGNDGVAHAMGSGGCPSYSYLWSTGDTTSTVTGLAAGTYFVTITDGAGGTYQDSVVLSAPSAILATATTESSCSGDSTGSVDLSVSGGLDCQGYTFLWSNGGTSEDLSNVAAGSYTVTVTDAGGCTTTQSFTVGALAALNPSFSQSGNTFTASQTWLTYQWLLNNANISGANANSYTATQVGSYSLMVTDSNGCSAVSDTTNITVLGIGGAMGDWMDLVIYPNPANGEFRLRTASPIGYTITVGISDMFGRQIFTQRFPELGNEVAFNIKAFSAGTYMVDVVSEIGQRKLFRLVVQ